MIREVTHLLNDKVIVANEQGKPIKDYEGKFSKVKDKILNDATGRTKFYVQGVIMPIDREAFATKNVWNFIKGVK